MPLKTAIIKSLFLVTPEYYCAAVERAATVAIAAQAATQRKERRQSNSHRQWQMKTRRKRVGMQLAGVT